MKVLCAALVLFWICALPFGAQAQEAVSIDKEPHHHLVLTNKYIEVHQILIEPGDAFKLHRHDEDEISIVVSGGTAIGENQGKPPALQTSQTGEVHYAPAPRVHLIRNTGKTTIHNVALSLLNPQTNLRNLCGNVVKGQPLNCPASASASSSAPFVDQPQFETDQTSAMLTLLRPKQTAAVGSSDRDELLVAIDDVALKGAGKDPEKVLHNSDFVWLNRGDSKRMLKNAGDKEARYVVIAFKPL
jgi:quercetin dioxygenase-like cupin family protein